jgi:ElaB/YqjD/DUF883 family membrane-anchored ribosome-binding protein
MATQTAETAVDPTEPTLRERVVDAASRVAHMSHEARMLKSVAADAVEDGVYKARRAVKNARREFHDARDEAAYRIKQDPLRAVGVAFGVGLVIGVASGTLGWLAARAARRSEA